MISDETLNVCKLLTGDELKKNLTQSAELNRFMCYPEATREVEPRGGA